VRLSEKALIGSSILLVVGFVLLEQYSDHIYAGQGLIGRFYLWAGKTGFALFLIAAAGTLVATIGLFRKTSPSKIALCALAFLGAIVLCAAVGVSVWSIHDWTSFLAVLTITWMFCSALFIIAVFVRLVADLIRRRIV
jgi:hypothetical protein